MYVQDGTGQDRRTGQNVTEDKIVSKYTHRENQASSSRILACSVRDLRTVFVMTCLVSLSAGNQNKKYFVVFF